MSSTTSDPDVRQRVAVMGGTGFMGRAIIAALEAAGYRTVPFARHAPAGADGFVSVDLGTVDPAELARILERERIGTVVNAAGGMWGLTDEQMVAANVTLVENIVAALAALPWRGRLVQLGSVHEYGLVPVGVTIAEDAATNPSMVYGELKVRATAAILEACDDGRIDALVLRMGNVVGAGQPGHSLLGVIAGKLSTAAAEGRTAELALQPLAARREFFDLRDAADAVVAAVASPAGGRIVNIGAGHASSAREMVELLIKVSEVPVEVEEVPGGGPADELEWQRLDVTLAADLLGWKPRRNLAEAMESLWAAHLEAAGAEP